MKFVDNASQAWRWFSVRMLAFIAVVTGLWAAVPPELQAIIPEDWRGAIIAFLALLAALGRLIDQSPQKPDDETSGAPSP
jgi:predicted benzoate:H+ symporter BenE